MPPKKSGATAAEKLLALYTTLMLSTRPLSLTELCDKLDCSKPTVSRLLAQLESSAFSKVVASKQGRENYYKLPRPRKMPHVCLNAEGLTQIALCMDFLAGVLPKNMRQEAQSALMNASFMLPEGAEQPFCGLGASLSKGRIDYEPFENILNTFIRAIAAHRICRVTYQSRRDTEPKTWDFAPKRLISYRECIYVAGFPVDEDGKIPNSLQLPLQRFRGCELTGKSSKNIPEPPLDAGKLGIMPGEPLEIAVRFSPSAATYAAERRWSADQRLEETPDGGIILHIRSQSPSECISWVLGFGPSAELLSPPWLRDELKAKVQTMLALYQDAATNQGDQCANPPVAQKG